jgi:hypothetical protein
MPYAKKLLIAKILVTIATLAYTFIPLFVDFRASHMAAEYWSAHARFHLGWTLSAHVFALPVLLYVLWGKLHGTGRSVRLVGFLGMAYTLGFFITAAMRDKLDAALHDPGHAHLIFGLDENLVMNLFVFVLLAAGVLLSVKRKEKRD